ncbi:MAG: MBL fold metallo-hydrolase, partial [Deltaproteobacteria bacterium]|nr:MBL fold metallo-hydrolase [Deltaproteobacteria bacterium]
MILIDNHDKITKFRLARTVFGRGLYFTAAYLVDGLLVDSGCAHTVNEFMVALEGSTIRSVVNTHTHEDHIAGNAHLQKKYSVRIYAHKEGLPVLANPRRVNLSLYQLVMWGYPEPSHAEPIGRILETEHYQFQIIHTPGHSLDHICLYVPNEGWLFTGDAYIGGRDRSLRA